MFLTMGVGLYTSRLVLDALGVVDYGIYGLVGGIVTIFAFLNSAMASATQRYLSFDIGKNDGDRLQKTFNATLNIHILLAVCIFILAETIGLWLVNTQLEIPPERVYAANWVYQFSVFAFILKVMQVPYNALLLARERMDVYAYLSILETALKLAMVLYLVKANTDKLILYSILTFGLAFIIRMAYKLYCKKHFKESRYKFYWNKAYYQELLTYSGWNLFGAFAMVVRGQGSNILLNIFFGPVANAAYALTLMVQGIIGSFVSNFQTAANPQIIKNYAVGDKQSSLNLIYKTSKFSFFGILIWAVPLWLNLEYVMNLWLKEVPPYVMDFIRLALVYTMIDAISTPLVTGAQATGKIKWYQIIIGTLIMFTFPITYFFFTKYQNPMDLYKVIIGISALSLLFRLLFLRKLMNLSLSVFFKEVILRISLVVLSLYIGAKIFTLTPSNNFLDFLMVTALSVLITSFLILLIGLTRTEHFYLINLLKNKLPKYLK